MTKSQYALAVGGLCHQLERGLAISSVINHIFCYKKGQ